MVQKLTSIALVREQGVDVVAVQRRWRTSTCVLSHLLMNVWLSNVHSLEVLTFLSLERALFCVFDGHAGKECAIDAKKFFPLELAAALQNHLADKEVGAILRATFLSTDDKLKHVRMLLP